MVIPAKISQRQTKSKGIAFDLTFSWKGTRYRPCLGYNLDPKEAKALALKRIQEIQAGLCDTKPKPAAPPTLNDAIMIFWDSFRAMGRIDESRPRGIINTFLLPFFGNRPLASFTARDGLDYLRGRQQDHAKAGTIRREFQILNRILNLAVAYDLLDKNRLKIVNLPEANKRTRTITNDELLRLGKTASGELWRAVCVALTTGLRESRLLALDRAWIKKEKDGYWVFLPAAKTKTKGNPSRLPLNRIALANTYREIESLDGGPIFTQWKDLSAFRKNWARACKRAGIQDLTFHDLRHSFVTRLQNCSVDYEIRQALLGHKMPGMTSNYSHGGTEWNLKLREAVTLLEKSLLNKKPAKKKLKGKTEGSAEKSAYESAYEPTNETQPDAAWLRNLLICGDISGEPRAARTHDPRLKRAMLYQLS